MEGRGWFPSSEIVAADREEQQKCQRKLALDGSEGGCWWRSGAPSGGEAVPQAGVMVVPIVEQWRVAEMVLEMVFRMALRWKSDG